MLSRRRAARSRRVASGVRKEARGTMADGAPACECGEPDNDDVMRFVTLSCYVSVFANALSL